MGIREYIQTFADSQREERINQCLNIEKALLECERVRASISKTETARIHLHDTRAGMKISRFYDWGLVNPHKKEAISAMREDNTVRSMHQSENANNEKVINANDSAGDKASDTKPSCSRERHAVWGCRAIALGCSSDLVGLKKCFQEKIGTTNPPYFAYESSDGNVDDTCDDCRSEMRKVGDCVLMNWKELNERQSQ